MIPPPACPLGYTTAQLTEIMGDRLVDFNRWMDGQTCSICEGRRYNHEAGRYEPDECADSPHGVVTYACDVERFLQGGRPLD